MRDPFDKVHQYVEALLQGKKPKRAAVDDERDWRALQFAARLAGDRHADEGPSPAFVARLQTQLVAEATGQKPANSHRRTLLAAAASGIAAGVGGFTMGRLTTPVEPPAQVAPASRPPMVRDNGQWFAVAKLSHMNQHAIMRFSAGAVEGHLVRMGNKVYALSAICSDAPCALSYQENRDTFQCPCHGVNFDMNGEPVGNRRPIPPLTPVQVKIENDDVLVWSIGENKQASPGSPVYD